MAKSANAGTIRIKQVRSGIGHPERHRLTLRAMGLKHHQDVVIQEMTPGLRGQINQVRHLVDVTSVDEGKGDKGKGKA